MLKAHQGGRTAALKGDERVSASATVTGDLATISFANLSATEGYDLEIVGSFGSASGRMLVGDSMTAHNDFEHPERVAPMNAAVTLKDGRAMLNLPAHSVASLSCRLG
jgi:alpha-L-arabinofuranosidase